MKTFTVVFLYLVIFIGVTHAQAQSHGGAFAAAAVPGQVPVLTPQPPTAARPAGQAQPTQQQQEQMRIVADPATNSLIIYGTAQEFQNIKNILKELDAIPRQVLLDVMVAEVTLTDDESFGVAYEIFRGKNEIFGQTFPSTGAVVAGTVPAAPTDSAGNIIANALTGFPAGMSGIIGRSNAIRAFINALASQNRIKALASPSILATDNKPARIQVGSEIPILTGQTSTFTGTSTPLTSNAIQYRNTGVILTVIPQVNSQGLVNLQVKQEVSDVGAANFGSTGSPSFTTRDAETNAVVQDGETLAIGGIIGDRKTRDRSGIPYLMDLPVLGRFFGSTTDHSTRTELVILITPHVSRNIDESRSVTQELKNKLSDVKNELDRLEREKEKRQSTPQVEPKVVPPGPSGSQPPAPNLSAPAPAPAPAPSAGPAAPHASTAPPREIIFGPKGSPIAADVEELPFQPAGPRRQAYEGNPIQQNTTETVGRNDAAAMEPPLLALAVKARGESRPAKAPAKTVAVGSKPGPVWMVQVAAFAQKKDAEALATDLRALGYDAFTQPAEVDAKIWHRVRVGKIPNRKDAVELQKTLKANNKFEQAFLAVQ